MLNCSKCLRRQATFRRNSVLSSPGRRHNRRTSVRALRYRELETVAAGVDIALMLCGVTWDNRALGWRQICDYVGSRPIASRRAHVAGQILIRKLGVHRPTLGSPRRGIAYPTPAPGVHHMMFLPQSSRHTPYAATRARARFATSTRAHPAAHPLPRVTAHGVCLLHFPSAISAPSAFQKRS